MRRSHDTTLQHAENAAKVQPAPTFEAAKIREHAGVQYIVDESGEDATLVNGRYPQKKVSDIVTTTEGCDYLGTLWRVANPDLKKVIIKNIEKGQ